MSNLAETIRSIPGYDPYATAAPGDWFDEAAARRACDFFPACLKHIEGTFSGQPFNLMPWQQAIIGNIFGWRREDGTRRYREAFVAVPRGSGKTPIASGVCIYCLFCDNEPGAQIYSAGADVQQAGLLFRHAKGMVNREPELSSRSAIHESYKSMTLKGDDASVYRVVSSDAAGKHGYAPHLVVCDELHAWSGRDLMDAFTSAFAKRGRRQPLLLHITTRDFDRESICNEKWKYAEQVRDGVVADRAFLPVIYAAGDEDDWTAEATWVKANPNIDVTVDRESLRRECEKAKATPAYENTFKRLHLNMKTQQDVRLFPIEQWDSCIVPGCTKALSKKTCYGGLDLSTTEDITARVLAFPNKDGLVLSAHFWVPEETLRKRSQKDQVDYALWVRQGHMTATPGNVIDYDFVHAKLLEDRKQYDLREVGYDPWNATQLAVKLEAERFKIEQVRQGFASLNEPTKRLITMLASGRIQMELNPVFRWMALNVAAETDAAGNLKPSKAKSTGRIDGVVAAIMAISMWMQHAKGAGAYTGKGASIWL